MTVLRMNSSDRYASSRPGGAFADPRRQNPWAIPAARQVQDWTRGLEINTSRRHEVIAEKRIALPVFSAKGIRWDALLTALMLLLLLFLGVLLADMQAISAGGARIGKLSAGIEALETSNTQLRQELSFAMNRPAVRSRADDTSGKAPLYIIQSVIPEE